MSRDHELQSETERADNGNKTKVRKRYRTPKLQELGDLRSLTLGGSPGVDDSGSAGIRKPPGMLPQPGGFPMPEGYPQPPGEFPPP